MLLSTTKNFYHSTGKIFCPLSRKWQPAESLPAEAVEILLIDAVKKLQTSQQRIRTPIGIIGTSTASPEQYQKAEIIGEKIAALGFTVLCGGKAGVMEAACKGVMRAGGISIGLLPEGDPDQSNQFVTIPIASGIGVARNALIARASLCLIAVGGSNGTISEIAYGLQFGKRVFGIEEKPYLEGMEILSATDALIQKICEMVFDL